MSDSSNVVPIIDFEPFHSGNEVAKQAVAENIYRACHEVGLMYLKNHGAPQAQIDQMFHQAKQFFNLPLDLKQSLARSQETNCGYVGVEVEQLNPQRPRDLKEAFNVGKPVIWPQDLPNFQKTVTAFREFCISEVALPVLRSFALGLRLPEFFFEATHSELFILRLLHYPPLTHPTKVNQLRAGEHTDYGSVTLLFQEAGAGLEVFTRKGQWVAAPPIPGAIVVNVGDAMQRWTNDQLRSTPHRVVNSDGDATPRSRYSAALFCDPNPDVMLNCLSTCQSPEYPPRYQPIRAGDYLKSRLAATYR